MINTLLLFRFQDSEPIDLDNFLFDRIIYRKDSLKYKATPFGFVALIQTKLSVRELHRRYRRQEKKHKRALPLFILNLRSERVECEGTFSNARRRYTSNQSAKNQTRFNTIT